VAGRISDFSGRQRNERPEQNRRDLVKENAGMASNMSFFANPLNSLHLTGPQVPVISDFIQPAKK